MSAENDYICRLTKGDIIRVDCPGTYLHGHRGLIVNIILWPYESDCEIWLTNPPVSTPNSIMLRDKWIKIISKIKKTS
jgi:hypothetical protein